MKSAIGLQMTFAWDTSTRTVSKQKGTGGIAIEQTV
jgi:hypothetical protein